MFPFVLAALIVYMICTMLPLLFVYALHAIVKGITKRGDWWFLCGFDFWAWLSAFVVCVILEENLCGKSFFDLSYDLVLPCWAWCLFIFARSILNLIGVKIDERKWSLWGGGAFVAVVVAACIFIPSQSKYMS